MPLTTKTNRRATAAAARAARAATRRQTRRPDWRFRISKVNYSLRWFKHICTLDFVETCYVPWLRHNYNFSASRPRRNASRRERTRRTRVRRRQRVRRSQAWQDLLSVNLATYPYHLSSCRPIQGQLCHSSMCWHHLTFVICKILSITFIDLCDIYKKHHEPLGQTNFITCAGKKVKAKGKAKSRKEKKTKEESPEEKEAREEKEKLRKEAEAKKVPSIMTTCRLRCSLQHGPSQSKSITPFMMFVQCISFCCLIILIYISQRWYDRVSTPHASSGLPLQVIGQVPAKLTAWKALQPALETLWETQILLPQMCHDVQHRYMWQWY